MKRLDDWTHFVVILFGVLKQFDSLRELEIFNEYLVHP
ncbi:DUF4372 domain-containing protein [Prevotella histicola]|nr:DUF4372 domain-containing protein [Prevotella melaninogenica]